MPAWKVPVVWQPVAWPQVLAEVAMFLSAAWQVAHPAAVAACSAPNS